MFVRTLDGSMINIHYIVTLVEMSDCWHAYMDTSACQGTRKVEQLSQEAVVEITTDETAPTPLHLVRRR